MSILAIQHINIRCADLEKSRAFYTGLGLKEGYRPPFSSKGYWMYLQNQPMVHLVQNSLEQGQGAGRTGKNIHIAFESDDIQGMRRILKDTGLAVREVVVPTDKSIQLFIHDPDGIEIELNFPSRGLEAQV